MGRVDIPSKVHGAAKFGIDGATLTQRFPRLVYAFEEWAKEQGASELSLGVSTGVQTEVTVRMYERMGYKMAAYGLIKAGV